jgi:hypothetical protein
MATGELMPFHEPFNSYSNWKILLERLDNVGKLSGGIIPD